MIYSCFNWIVGFYKFSSVILKILLDWFRLEIKSIITLINLDIYGISLFLLFCRRWLNDLFYLCFNSKIKSLICKIKNLHFRQKPEYRLTWMFPKITEPKFFYLYCTLQRFQIDPGDVNVRFGEEGSIGVYFAKSASMSSLCSSTNTSSATTTTPSSLSSSPVGHHQLLTSSHSLVATTPGRHQRPLATAAAPNPVVRSLNLSPTRLFPDATTTTARQSPSPATMAPPSDNHMRNGSSSYQLCGNVHLGAGKALLPLVESATAWRHHGNCVDIVIFAV